MRVQKLSDSNAFKAGFDRSLGLAGVARFCRRRWRQAQGAKQTGDVLEVLFFGLFEAGFRSLGQGF